MKRKGFTLIEMLAVIAVLGILVIMVMPNVLKSYRDSKKVAFIDEAKVVYTKATDAYVMGKTKGQKITYISNEVEDTTQLDLKAKEDLKYTVQLDRKTGKVTSFVLKNTEFCIVGIGDFLNDYTKEQVIDYRDTGSGVNQTAIDLCNSETYRPGTPLEVQLVDKINDRVNTGAKPKDLLLKYNQGWYEKGTERSLSTGIGENVEYKIDEIPTKTNYYYKGSEVEGSSVKVIGCDGKILVNLTGQDPDGKYLFLGKTNAQKATSQWMPKHYKVSFTGGNGQIETITVNYGEQKNLPSNKDANGYGKDIKNIGHKFTGWLFNNSVEFNDKDPLPVLTDENENEIVNGIDHKLFKFDNAKICSGEQTIDNTKSFVAQWIPIKYTVKYDPNGGTGTMAPTTDTYDSNETFRENTFTRTGYTFLGWSLNKNKTTADYTDKSNIPNLASLEGAEVTVYAIWKARGYVVTFDMNGGEEGQSTSLNATYDVDINISKPSKKYTVNINENDQDATLSATSVNGYQTFSGWSSNKSNGLGSNAKNGESDADTPWDGTVTTKPHFKSLRDTEGSVKLTANWSSTDITLPTISKTGYTCGFVDNASDTTIKYNSGGTYKTSNNGESVTIYAKCNLIKITLADAINRDNTSIGNNVYNKTGTTESEGGYYTASDVYGTSYYFRGNVNNNYVVFADKCWRVVRIDGNGNVRLILYNKNSSSCTTTGNSNAFVGNAQYNLTASSVGTVKYYNSNLQQYINTWYSNAFTSAQKSKLAQTIWCADETKGVVESGTPAPSGSIYFKARNRIVPQNVTNPTMGCATTGHSRINSKVGFISSDEIIYAGGAEKGGSYFTEYHYYLLPNATSNAWWVLGSNKYDNVTDGAAAFAVLGNNQIARNGISTDMVTSEAGGLDCRRVSESLGVRPMIAIVPSALITNSSQDGTASNPYIVKEN